MMTATRAQYQRALDKAKARGGARLVTETDQADRWIVQGTTQTYLVRERSGELVCSCLAAERDWACYHIAAVFMFKAGRAAVRSVSPAPASYATLLDQRDAELRRGAFTADPEWVCPM